MEFIVGHRRCLSVEFIKADRLVRVCEGCNGKRVARVVHKHIRVAAHFREVDNVIFHILVIAADTLHPPKRLGGGAESLDHLSCPYFSQDTGTQCAIRGKLSGCKGYNIARHGSYSGRQAGYCGKHCTRSAVKGNRTHHTEKGANCLFDKIAF